MGPMSADQMRFASSIAEDKDPALAVEASFAQIRKQLDGFSPHVAFLFVSILYRTPWESILRKVQQELKVPLLLGCTGGGILGVDRELESVPAMSLVAAHLPRVELHPFAVAPEDLEEERESGFWIEKLGVNPGRDPVGVLLPEPFSCDCGALVESLNRVYPKMPLVGGLASGGEQEGENALFLNDRVVREGAVGVLMTGDVTLQTVVAQGCRPIGRPYIITKAEGNFILELAGHPALEALRQLFQTLSDEDRELARRALFLGVVTDEQKEKFQRGGFLIRNIIGMDPSTGALAVGDRLEVGQTVQFQVRDAQSSREDLQQLLRDRSKEAKDSSAGALLFSCLGRGKDLYGEPHVDIRTIQAALGDCPIAGFFCNGEIGPVAERNFIHGFTASLGLFRPR